jgi:hypothetical protein
MKAPVDGCATALAPWRFDPSELHGFLLLPRTARLFTNKNPGAVTRPGFVHSSE